ncbi:OPT/YSL family transporter [Myxococcaceae bacterium GXIMD 01537]
MSLPAEAALVPARAEAGGAELTVRALAVGCAIGALLAVTNVYMGLKTSWWESGCILSSVLGLGVLGPLTRRGGAPYSVLENNLTQTAASAVGAVPAAAGLLGSMPALAMLGHSVPAWAVAAWGLALGLLGVLAAFLLRPRLIVEEALPFPTGAATAELLSTLHGAGEARARRAWGLGGVTLASMAVTWLRDARGWLPQLSALPGQLAGLPASTFTLGVAWSPMLLGIGAMAGPHMGLSMLLGSLGAWAGLAPQLVRSGVAPGGGYEALAGWLIWPGVGLMVGAAAAALAGQARSLVQAARDMGALGGAGVGRWVAGVGLAALAVVLALAGVLGMSLGQALLALVLLPPLCAVCARAAGQTDIAPVSQMGQLSQAAAGALAPGGLAPNVAVGAVVSGAAAHTGVSLWALKAGHLLGASPRRQLLAQWVGVAVGAAVAVPAYQLLVAAWPPGSEALPAPAALQFRAVAELSVRGLAGLPPGAALAAGVGAVVGAVLTLAARGRWARWLPSPVAMGIGFIVPAAYGVTLCLGALAVAGARRVWPEATGRQAPGLGAGAIAGESLLGVFIAALLALGVMRPG